MNGKEEKRLKKATGYKADCGFRRIGCCKFPQDQCDIDVCSMYVLEFTSKSIKQEIKKIKDEIKKLSKELDISELKELKKFVSSKDFNKDDKRISDFKKTIKKIVDYKNGLDFMKKAYLYCKRTGK